MSTVHTNAGNGNVNRVRNHLNNGVHVNVRDPEFNRTPLHYAAEGGHLSTVQLLLNRRAQVNARNAEGITPLMLAAMGGHLAIVRLLIARRASLNTMDSNRLTALMYASMYAHPRVVRELLLAGANRTIRGNLNNSTAYEQANNNNTYNVFNNVSRATATIRRHGRAALHRRRISQTRRRAPLGNVAAAVFHPARVNRMGGSNWLNQL
jgi:ankyrin repeat protein